MNGEGKSPFIVEKYLKDPTFNELNMKLLGQKTNDDIVEEFKKFIKGEKIPSEIFYEIQKK